MITIWGIAFLVWVAFTGGMVWGFKIGKEVNGPKPNKIPGDYVPLFNDPPKPYGGRY